MSDSLKVVLMKPYVCDNFLPQGSFRWRKWMKDYALQNRLRVHCRPACLCKSHLSSVQIPVIPLYWFIGISQLDYYDILYI